MIRALLRLPRVFIGLLRGDDLATFGRKARGRQADSERNAVDATIDTVRDPAKVAALRGFAAKKPGGHRVQ